MTKETTHLIALQDVSKEIRNDSLVVPILFDIDLIIDEGEFVAIMGPSGSGKSTLMNIIGFLDTPTGGTYSFKGRDVSKLSEDELARFRASEVGFVFQAFHLLPKTTVLENVKMPLLYSTTKMSDREQTERARAVIESVGLTHRIAHLSNQLSGGEKQRVAIARALVNNPTIILADEPTGNLDSVSGLAVMRILQDLNTKQNRTIILVTHEQLTAEHARRIISIKDGRVSSSTIVSNHRLASNEEHLK